MFHSVAALTPSQIKRDVALYACHVEDGESLSSIGRRHCFAPSTVLRAVRRIEDRREDPLFEELLDRLGDPSTPASSEADQKETRVQPRTDSAIEKREFDRECRRILRKLEEPKAFLLVAKGAPKAGVFSPSNKFAKPVAMAPGPLAQAMLSHDLIAKKHTQGQTARYEITDAGRARLARLTGRVREREAPQDGPSAFAFQHQVDGERVLAEEDTGKESRRRVNLGETPLGWLARRKGADGTAFLTRAEVEAGERLRDDFERAQIGPRVAQDWSSFLAPSDGAPGARSPAMGPADARKRFAAALDVLGPGLSDVALRACCFLEGLESTERRMGWSARSGKVVLKIALQRLVTHYGFEPTAIEV